MDYKQESFYGMSNQNTAKMPFYMAYPMQNIYLEEMEYVRDMEKLKEMYPKEVRDIQRLVEDECDKMEYEGSMMFDETPDRLMLARIVDRIYDGVAGRNMAETYDFEAEQYEGHMQAEELPMEGARMERWRPEMMPPRPGRRPSERRRHRDNDLENLIRVLLFNEMHQRRCRHRRCRRWW